MQKPLMSFPQFLQQQLARRLSTGHTAASRPGTWQLQPLVATAVLLTAGLPLGIWLANDQAFASDAHYLPIHNLLEILSVAISLMVFLLVSSLSRHHLNNRLLLLGCTFLGVALIDIGHILSYVGMADLLTPNSTNKSIIFWLAGRYLLCFGLLGQLLPLRACGQRCLWLMSVAVLAVAALAWWTGILHPEWLPRFHVEDRGLTPVKVGAEYLLTAVYGSAAVLLYLQTRRSSSLLNGYLALAAWTIALSEVFFTLYVQATDFFNLVGHFYKLVAYYLFYRGIFISGVQSPYAELDRERSWLNSLLSSIPEPVWLKDPAGVYLSCNAAFRGLCGLDPEQVVGRNDYELFHPDNADTFRRYDLKALEQQEVSINEEWIDTWSHGHRLYRTSKIAVRLPNGATLGVLGIANDITEQRQVAVDLRELADSLAQEVHERRQIELQLVESNQRYHALIRNLPLPLFATDREGRISTWNEAAQTSFGSTEEDMRQQSCRTLFAPVSLPDIERILQQAASGTVPRSIEVTCHGRHGAVIQGLLYVSPIFTIDGQIDTLIFMIEDHSERRAIEAQLRQSQKLEAIGQLTAGVAHDFNNILAVMLGNLELLIDAMQDADKRQLARNAFDAGKRGASLTQSLLAYSCKQSLAPVVVDVSQLISNDLRLLRLSLPESIEITLNLAPGLWQVQVDASRLQDAILNLALNARDAMKDGGHLKIAAANVLLGADAAPCRAGLPPGRYVQLSVSDTGSGIPAELLHKVLEPFFTTKPVGAGSGLGLPMVYGFVKQSGGHFDIHSSAGKGTTVTIHLPALQQEQPLAVARHDSNSTPLALQGECVLLVEDNADVRALVQTYLVMLGYTCLAAADGAAALQLLQKHRPDLLLTDMVLPNGMGGPDIARQALLQQPALKVLFMSGYAEGVLEGQDLDGLQLLQKPFNKNDLARKLRGLLDE